MYKLNPIRNYCFKYPNNSPAAIASLFLGQNTKVRNRRLLKNYTLSFNYEVKIIFFLLLAHVIDLEQTHLAAEFHRSDPFSLGAMTPFRIFVKCETGK